MAARKPKDWLNLADEDAADVPAAAVSTLSEPESEVSSNVKEPDWRAELSRAKEHATQALTALSDWHTRRSKLQSQLDAVKAEQQAALEDHSADSEERVERIAAAQIRQTVILADLEHERAPRNQLVAALRERAKACGQPVQIAYMRDQHTRKNSAKCPASG